MRQRIIEAAWQAGAVKVGFARAGEVSAEAIESYRQWLADGMNGEMNYLQNHQGVRSDVRRLFDDVPASGTVIVFAFSYYQGEETDESRSDVRFARYARGDDYHEVVRRRLGSVANIITEAGGKARICVDTAPVMERYWAREAGVGFTGKNGLLITREAGSWVFLAEIVTDLEIVPDAPCTDTCAGCGRCVRSCPGGAIGDDGRVDARRCLSYLTIEKRGEWSAQERELIERGDSRSVYGCDVCQRVCPHNRHADAILCLPEFMEREEIRALSRQKILNMAQEEFSRIFRGSAVKRAKLAGLRRNAGERSDRG